MVAAITLVVRAELRRHRWTLALSALIVVLVTGAVLTAAAGARRTASVLDRMQAAHPQPDLSLSVNDPRFASDVDQVRDLEARLAKLDGVERVVAIHNLFIETGLDEGFWLSTGPDDHFLETVDVIVVNGRLPGVESEAEVAIDEPASTALGLGVGDVLVAPTIRTETAAAAIEGTGEWLIDGPELVLDVVGVYRSGLEVDGVPSGIGSPDTGSYIGEAVAFDVLFAIGADPDVFELEQAIALAYEAAPDAWVYWGDGATLIEPVRTAFDVIAAGLTVFALVALAGGLVALGQLVSRQISQSDSIAPIASALGMSHRAITVATALPAIVAIVVGSLIGSVVSVLLSPMFPIAAARRAEVDPGIRVDWAVLVVGSLLIVGSTSMVALIAAARQGVRRETEPSAATHGRWASVRRMLPVSAGVGIGSVSPEGHRARAAPRSAVVGSVTGIAGFVAIAVFVVSQQAAADDATRLGWGWDSQPEVIDEDPGKVLSALADDDRLAAVGTAFCGDARFDDTVTSLCALDVVSGSISLTFLEGRGPTSPDEVAAGLVTMDEYDLDVGDIIEVTGESENTRALKVVGVVVQPDETAPGEGLVVNGTGFDALSLYRAQQYVVLAYPDGVDADELEAALVQDYPVEFNEFSHPRTPDSLRQLERVRSTLIALAAFLGVLGVVGLVHFLVLSGNRRRAESAVLRAIGFVRRQTVAVVVWQAVAIAAIGVIVGVPLGVLVGRSVWIESVDHIGIADHPTMPWLVIATVVVVAIAGAVVIALIPGWWAARRSPRDALRTE